MTSPKTIIGIALIAIIAFALGYFVGPNIAEAPALGGSSASSVALKQAPAGSSIIPVSIVTLSETASTSPTITIQYPQFPSFSSSFNASIASSVTSRLADFKQSVTDNEKARQATADPNVPLPPSGYSFIVSWQPAQITGRYASFVMRYDMYTGGANENQEIQTFNYDIAAGKAMILSDLFPDRPDYLTSIANMARADLTSSLNEASNGNMLPDMLAQGTAPTTENFANFTFTDYIVTVYFPKYAVAPGSFGEQHVDIPLSSVK